MDKSVVETLVTGTYQKRTPAFIEKLIEQEKCSPLDRRTVEPRQSIDNLARSNEVTKCAVAPNRYPLIADGKEVDRGVGSYVRFKHAERREGNVLAAIECVSQVVYA